MARARQACDNIDVATFCIMDSCGSKASCPAAHSCEGGKSATLIPGDTSTTPYICTVLCRGAPSDCVPTANGNGDPHMTAFDGSSFSFQGVAGQHYVLFGSPRGDLLTTRMRGTRRPQPGTNTTGTFFDAFGIRTASGRRVRVVLAKDSGGRKGRLFRPVVSVDGTLVESEGSFEGVSITIADQGESVEIATSQTRFAIHGVALNEKEERHMDVSIKLVGRPDKSSEYVGVLGFTLNKVNGRRIHKDLSIADRSVQDLETAMRRRFSVQSLFPQLGKQGLVMRGVVRMYIPERVNDVVGEGLTASGVTQRGV